MLAILATHPIQYQVPIWKRLAERKRVPFEVWYLTAHGVKPSLDIEFARVFQWDMDLLGGYPNRFPPDPVPQQLGGFWDVGLCKDFRSRLTGGAVTGVLVAGWNVRACWEATFLAHRAGVQVWMRGDSNDLKVDRGFRRVAKRWLLGGLLDRVDRFLCVGGANRRLYRGYGVGDERLVAGPHCVDNGRFAAQARQYLPEREALRRAWGVPDGTFCLLYVGKFIPEKCPLDLVAAARRLAGGDAPRGYHLLFVGSGELGVDVRRHCRVVYDAESVTINVSSVDAGAPNASFTGFLNQTDISKAYVAADALVLPSVSETWGLVINEAMASGLPCVASAACGAAEDLLAPINPRLVYPSGSVEALVASIDYLANHPIPGSAIAGLIAQFDYIKTVDTLEQLWDGGTVHPHIQNRPAARVGC